MSTRAGVWHRAAAWSLDAAACALVVAAAFASRWGSGLRELDQRTQATFVHAYEAMARHGLGDGLPDMAGLLDDSALRGAILALQAGLLHALIVPVLAFTVAMGVLQTLGAASRRAASPGKRALGLRVVRPDGTRAGPVRVLLREAAGLLSWLSLNIGHALAAGPRRLALHDRIAGLQVVQDTPAPLPAWARAWLLLQGAAMVLGTVWLALHLLALAGEAAQRVFG